MSQSPAERPSSKKEPSHKTEGRKAVKIVPTCLKVRGTSRYTSSTRMALMSTKVRPTWKRR